eukprot:TRINITY_DN625_c2_g1_i9.p5 TRINITY_DN625_c2_g1~~TRINITY_DN625_c2_g1_i9.p5  ORF type:complete len:214 (+),score=9.38 TRINITY_DN625_c2_g1_i9:1175-1816(+)
MVGAGRRQQMQIFVVTCLAVTLHTFMPTDVNATASAVAIANVTSLVPLDVFAISPFINVIKPLNSPIPQITATSPSPPFYSPTEDTCDQKLQNLKECLQNKMNWVSGGWKSRYYSYNIQRSCFCNRIDTMQEQISVCAAISTETQAYQDLDNMIKVFNFVCDAIMEADSVDVEYDHVYYFPTYVNVDYIALALDDEISYTISGFQELTEETCP